MASETFHQPGENLFGDELVELIAGRAESQKAKSTVLCQLRQQQPRKRMDDNSFFDGRRAAGT